MAPPPPGRDCPALWGSGKLKPRLRQLRPPPARSHDRRRQPQSHKPAPLTHSRAAPVYGRAQPLPTSPSARGCRRAPARPAPRGARHLPRPPASASSRPLPRFFVVSSCLLGFAFLLFESLFFSASSSPFLSSQRVNGWARGHCLT